MASASALQSAAATGYHHDIRQHPAEPSNELRYTLESYEPSQAHSPPDQYTTTLTPSGTPGYSSGYLTYLTDQKTLEPSQGPFERAQYKKGAEIENGLSVETSISLETFIDASQPNCYDVPLRNDWKNGGHLSHTLPSSPLSTVMRQLQEINPLLASSLKEADSHMSRGQAERAIQSLERSLIQASGYPRLQALMWMLLGNAHMQLRGYKKASMCYLRYLELCKETQDFPGTTRAECKLGISYMMQGLLQMAGTCFTQHLENSTVLQDDIGIAAACSNLGIVSRLLAVQNYRAGLKEGETRQAEAMLSTTVCQAVIYFQQHLAIMEHHGDLEKQARAYGNLGYCYQLLKQHTQAIHCHSKRLEIVRILGDRESECCTLCNLGNCSRATGRLQEALECYHLGYELCQVAGNQRVEMVTLLNLGTTCELTNKLSKAIEWHTLYLSMTVVMSDVRGQARGLATLTCLYEETKQVRKAQDCSNKLADSFKSLGAKEPKLSATRYLQTVRQRCAMRRRYHGNTRSAAPHGTSHTSGHGNAPFGALLEVSSSKQHGGSWAQQQHSIDPYSVNNTRPLPHPPHVVPSQQLMFENPAVFMHELHYSTTDSDIANFSSRTDQTPTPSPASSLCFPYSYHSSPDSSTSSDERTYRDYPPPLPPRRYSVSDLSDTDSSTDYESIPDLTPAAHSSSCDSAESESVSTCSSEVWESGEELRGLEDLTPSTSCGGSIMEVDKEWEQWINLRNINCLSRVVSMSRGDMRVRGHRVAAMLKPAHSAPHVDLCTHEQDNDTSTVCSESSLAI